MEPLGANVADPAAESRVGQDGRFEIAALPGPGVLAFRASQPGYTSPRIGRQELAEIIGEGNIRKPGDQIRFLTTEAGGQSQGVFGTALVHAAALLSPSGQDRSVTVDLSCQKGRTRKGTILDEKGSPIAGVHVVGLGPSESSSTEQPVESAEFLVQGLVGGRERRLFFLHQERELGAQVTVSGDDDSLISVTLQPTGTISGRLIDNAGQPMNQVKLFLSTVKPALVGGLPNWASVDTEGQFKMPGIVPDTQLGLFGVIPDQPANVIHPEFHVKSGETVDLGVFRLKNKNQFERVEESAE